MKLGLFSAVAPSWPAEEVARAATEAGFAGIEWEIRAVEGHISLGTVPEDASERRAQSEAAGLEICCVSAHPTLSLLDPEHVDGVVEAARGCGAPLARMFAPPFDGGTSVWKQLETVRGALARHAERFADVGVTLVIELSQETLVPSPELLRRACDGLAFEAVGALYDPANMLEEGNLSPPFALAVLGEYLHHVHVKNEAFTRSQNGRWTPAIVPADEGLVDWSAAAAALRDAGYAGWAVIDHLSDEPSVEQMRLERETLERLWTREENA